MHTATRSALAAALACALGSAWLPAAAQARSADPAAPVPPTIYRPPAPYRPEAGTGTTPDRNWADSNATVAATDSMALTMKMRRMPAQADDHAGHAVHAPQGEHGDHGHHGGASAAMPAPKETP